MQNNISQPHWQRGILVEAQQKIVLHSGQSAIVLEGDNIIFTCPGVFSVKGACDAASMGALPSETRGIQLPEFFDEDELEKYFKFINTTTGEAITSLQFKVEVLAHLSYT